MKPTQEHDRTPKLIAEFTVSGEPVSKSRARFTKRGSKTFAYTPEKTLQGERIIAATYRTKVRTAPSDSEVAYRVEMHFYNGTRQRRDVDNMCKLVLDGLNGVAWVDDNQVVEIEARKSYVTKDDARTSVRVYEVGRLNPPTAPCIRCGKPFRTYNSWIDNPNGKKYCSRECVNLHRIEKKERICHNCGETFQAWGPSKETKFCSKACMTAASSMTKPCTQCGVDIVRTKSYFRGDKHFCSANCQAAYKRSQAKTSKAYGTCIDCGCGVTKPKYERCAACRIAYAAKLRAEKTHCSKGHELVGDNLRIESRTGRKLCRTCKIESAERRRLIIQETTND